jgi:hypothetical protein
MSVLISLDLRSCIQHALIQHQRRPSWRLIDIPTSDRCTRNAWDVWVKGLAHGDRVWALPLLTFRYPVSVPMAVAVYVLQCVLLYLLTLLVRAVVNRSGRKKYFSNLPDLEGGSFLLGSCFYDSYRPTLIFLEGHLPRMVADDGFVWHETMTRKRGSYGLVACKILIRFSFHVAQMAAL